jgi:coenzyme PQQ precursor peptide PqqA
MLLRQRTVVNVNKSTVGSGAGMRRRVLTGTRGRSTLGMDQQFRITTAEPEEPMKLEWQKPEVKEEEVGLEVTSYASAELDRT